MTNLPVQRDLSPVQMLDGPPTRSRMPEPQRDFGAVLDRARDVSSRSPQLASERSPIEARAYDEPSRSTASADRNAAKDADAKPARESGSRNAGAEADKASQPATEHGPAKEAASEKAASDKAQAASAHPAKSEDEGTAKRSPPEEETKLAERSPGAAASDASSKDALSSKKAKIKGAEVGTDPAAILAHEKAAAAAKAAVAIRAGAQPKIAIEGAEQKPAAGVTEKRPKKGDGAEALTAALLAGQLVKTDKAASAAEGAGPGKKEAGESGAKRNDGIQAGQGVAKSTTSPQLTVIDLRGAARHDVVPQSPDSGLQPGGGEPKHQSFEVRLFGIDTGGRAAPDSFVRNDSLILPSRQDAVNTLQQSWGPLMNQVVKSAGIVMRDNESGEIRLVLKPEHLGSVRIQLEMKDSLISGKIVVENQSVRQLFQQNLESLYRAFQESGFSTGALNVSVGGNGTGTREKGRYSGLPGAEAISGLKSLADHIPDLQVIGRGESLVNLVV